MKIKRYFENVVISLVAGILLEVVILPDVTAENKTPAPTPFEVSMDLSFRMEIEIIRQYLKIYAEGVRESPPGYYMEKDMKREVVYK